VVGVRVLLGDLPPAICAAFSAATRPRRDIEMVGVVAGPAELLLAAGLLHADVLVVSMVGDGLPGVASHLLDQYPHVTVLAVAPDGRRALRCARRPGTESIALAGPADLVQAVRSAACPLTGPAACGRTAPLRPASRPARRW
jgi:hypothetical protein